MQETSRVDSLTVRSHKRQFIWQILLPFLVAAGLIVAAAMLVVTGETPGTRAWADVSIIWLIAPLLIFALFMVIVLGFLIYAVGWLTKVTPRFTVKVQMYTAKTAAGTRKVADGAVKPIVWIRQAGAVVKSIFRL